MPFDWLLLLCPVHAGRYVVYRLHTYRNHGKEGAPSPHTFETRLASVCQANNNNEIGSDIRLQIHLSISKRRESLFRQWSPFNAPQQKMRVANKIECCEKCVVWLIVSRFWHLSQKVTGSHEFYLFGSWLCFMIRKRTCCFTCSRHDVPTNSYKYELLSSISLLFYLSSTTFFYYTKKWTLPSSLKSLVLLLPSPNPWSVLLPALLCACSLKRHTIKLLPWLIPLFTLLKATSLLLLPPPTPLLHLPVPTIPLSLLPPSMPSLTTKLSWYQYPSSPCT